MAERSRINNLLLYATLTLAAMPILGMRPMVMVIVCWLLISAISRSRIGSVQPIEWRTVLILSAPFLLMVIDLLRADDITTGWHAVERSAALIIFPIGFFVFGAPSDVRLRKRMIDVFTVAAIALAVFVNLAIFVNESDLEPSTTFSADYRDAFFGITGVHPPFAAYWFFSAALFQVQLALQNERNAKWRMVFASLLVISGAMIGSRMPIIAFGVALATLLLFRFDKRKALLWISSTVVALGVLVMILPGSRTRVIEAYNTLSSEIGTAGINSVSVRSPILQCSLQLLEEHWIIGMGQSAVQPALDACYQANKLPILADGSYSTHNQPLHWWISFGILGLVAFILLFGYSLRIAMNRRDAIHVAFVVFILLCCFTENVLGRQWGVVVFACFNSLFMAAPIPRSVKVDGTAYFSETGAPRSTQ